MVPHGGTETRAHREIRALGQEIAGSAELAGTRVHADVALLHDWANWWALESDAHPAVLDLLDAHRAHYAPLFDAHVTCDVVPPTANLSRYRLVVVPNLYLMSAEVAARLRRYVESGGHLMVSFFSGIVDESDRAYLGGYPAPLRDLLGLRIDEFWPLPAGGTIGLDFAGERHTGSVWSEWIETEGAEVVATFTDGELAGRPAVTRHSYGAGVVWYLATRPEPALMGALFDHIREGAGVEPVLPDLPAGLQAVVRHGADRSYLLLLNHGADTVTVALPAPAVDLLGDRERAVDAVSLAPRGVAVLRR